MGSLERSRKKVQLWKKAIFHFSFCFVMGFFTGFAPTGKATIFSRYVVSPSTESIPVEMIHRGVTVPPSMEVAGIVANKTFVNPSPDPRISTGSRESGSVDMEDDKENEEDGGEGSMNDDKELFSPEKLVIMVTPISSTDGYRGGKVLLRRLANTIKLVPPPLLWIIVEWESDCNEVSEMLRKTGVMYRHLVSKENFTDPEAELNHQRNIALRHIEQHKLSGIVHFAGLNNVYDLDFFNQLRDIEVFGTWAMALLSANRQRIKIEGPVCDSSKVIGWHLRKMNNETDSTPPIHISSFGFNSSILWDPERWGRPSSALHGTQQNSIKYVKEVVLEDDAKLKGIPTQDCSKVMLWHLQLPTVRDTSATN